MTSRERIQAVLNHQTPDTLPIDFGSHRSSGMGATAYNIWVIPRRPRSCMT